MKEIAPTEITENMISLIGKDWLLVTAGDESSFNTMTASWGMIGFLWNKPVAMIFVRPERYTYEFMERKERFSLSFFTKEYRSALMLCGTKSGRDVDKVKETGLTPYFTPEGTPAFAEAKLVIECRTLYKDGLKPELFVDKEPVGAWYGGKHGNFHAFYVAEIVGAWVKE